MLSWGKAISDDRCGSGLQADCLLHRLAVGEFCHQIQKKITNHRHCGNEI